MITQEQIRKMHNGLWRTPVLDAMNLMPELSGILRDLGDISERPLSEYTVDVKVHMLMPNQYPCIPNWHFDNIPRDENGKQDFSKKSNLKMYLWVSNGPLIEFRKPIEGTDCYGIIKPQQWVGFTQDDDHRSTKSDSHTWRLFIRACPWSILKPNPPEKWIRRHSQVYLDSATFSW